MKAYQFKITIKNSKPPIWRRCIVPAGITFSKLAEVFIDVMGWSGYHLSEFEFYHEKLRIIDNCEDEEFGFYDMYDYLEASETVIDDFMKEGGWFTYVYDLGDDWQHRITIEKIIEDYEYNYPQVIKYKGNCPFEDCGGIYGYYECLEVLNDENHPEHEERLQWLNDQMYWEEYDIESVNNDFEHNFDLGSDRLTDDLDMMFDDWDDVDEKVLLHGREKLKDEKKKLILSCFDAAAMLYGVVPSSIIVKMYNRCCESEKEYTPIDIRTLKEEIKDIPEEYFEFEYIDNKYVSKELIENDEYEDLLIYQGNKDYYIPSYDEIMQISMFDCLPEEPMVKRLQMFLTNKLNVEFFKAEACSEFAQRMICDGYDMQEILSFFETNNVLVKNKKQLNELVILMNDFWNDTRMKLNRGFKPSELTGNKKLKIIPQESFNEKPADNIISIEQRRVNKIYPNDPCPCGSGKKYKKCCGRKKEERRN